MRQTWDEVWAVSPDGLRLFARRYGEEGDGVLPVVCLPGLARNAADFDRLAGLLAENKPGRVVIAVDYRGRGRSDHDPDPSHYTVPVETGDVLALLSTLGIGRAIFVGTSRGGLVAMALAASRPDLVAGAVLNDIGPVIDVAGLLRIKSYVGRLGRPADLDEGAATVKRLFSGQFPNLSDAEWRDWAAGTWSVRDGAPALDYDPELARTLDAIAPDTVLPDLWPLYAALAPVPLLVVRGALSDLLSAETLLRMAAEHPDVETLSVADEGHTPLLHRPDVFAAIDRLVARAEARPAAATDALADLPAAPL